MKKIFKLLASTALPTMALCCAPLTSCGNKQEVTFENDDWKNVVTLANEGLDSLKSYYNVDTFVGLERTINIYGYEYRLRVIGENEDRIADESGQPTDKFAALTFQFAQLLSIEYESGEVWPMAIEFTNAQQSEVWKNSYVRDFLNKPQEIGTFTFDFKKSIEDNLGKTGSIKMVSKNSYNADPAQESKIKSNPEYIFLPALGDIYNSATDQLPYAEKEGYEYEYEANYINGSYQPYSYFTKNIDSKHDYEKQSHVLILNDVCNHSFPYWLRSAYCDNTTPVIPVWYMNYDGECSNCITDPADRCGLAPIFCI